MITDNVSTLPKNQGNGMKERTGTIERISAYQPGTHKVEVRWDDGRSDGTHALYGGIEEPPFRVRTGLDPQQVYDLKFEDDPKPEIMAAFREHAAQREPSTVDFGGVKVTLVLRDAEDALRLIRYARDYCAETGQMPSGLLGEDQAFDDWAADLADSVLADDYSGLCDNCAAAKAGGGHWPETPITVDCAFCGKPVRPGCCDANSAVQAQKGNSAEFPSHSPEYHPVIQNIRALVREAKAARHPQAIATRELDRLVAAFYECDHADEFAEAEDLTVVGIMMLLANARGGA